MLPVVSPLLRARAAARGVLTLCRRTAGEPGAMAGARLGKRARLDKSAAPRSSCGALLAAQVCERIVLAQKAYILFYMRAAAADAPRRVAARRGRPGQRRCSGAPRAQQRPCARTIPGPRPGRSRRQRSEAGRAAAGRAGAARRGLAAQRRGARAWGSGRAGRRRGGRPRAVWRSGRGRRAACGGGGCGGGRGRGGEAGGGRGRGRAGRRAAEEAPVRAGRHAGDADARRRGRRPGDRAPPAPHGASSVREVVRWLSAPTGGAGQPGAAVLCSKQVMLAWWFAGTEVLRLCSEASVTFKQSICMGAPGACACWRGSGHQAMHSGGPPAGCKPCRACCASCGEWQRLREREPRRCRRAKAAVRAPCFAAGLPVSGTMGACLTVTRGVTKRTGHRASCDDMHRA